MCYSHTCVIGVLQSYLCHTHLCVAVIRVLQRNVCCSHTCSAVISVLQTYVCCSHICMRALPTYLPRHRCEQGHTNTSTHRFEQTHQRIMTCVLQPCFCFMCVAVTCVLQSSVRCSRFLCVCVCGALSTHPPRHAHQHCAPARATAKDSQKSVL